MNLRKNILAVVLISFLVVTFSSCAKRVSFQSSSYAPTANGRVKVKKDKNNNYNLDIFVRNLAESKNLEAPRDNYVVWSETESNGVKNIGQITSSTRLFSKKLKASLHAVSSYKPTRIFITTEDNGNVQYPGFRTILTTNSF